MRTRQAGSPAPLTQFGRGVRRQSDVQILGMPLWSVAMGPDAARGERRGHARGFFAVGDIATGIVAVGGMARGVVAIGGLAIGVFAVGGCAVGALLAFGGAAVGLLAIGGAAFGFAAMGGLAVGEFAIGGKAIGEHVISPGVVDPTAIRFFDQFGLHPPRR